jgi:hypothetical protein
MRGCASAEFLVASQRPALPGIDRPLRKKKARQLAGFLPSHDE